MMTESKSPCMALIAAVAENNVIGDKGDMVWKIKSELQYFKRTTIGKPVIHGRKSFESLGGALPNRPNIVVTRNADYKAEGITVVTSLDDAIALARKLAAESNVDEFFVAGGADIYGSTLPMADRLYLTEVHLNPEGETKFPVFDRNEWVEIKREFHPAQPGESADYTITVLERKLPKPE